MVCGWCPYCSNPPQRLCENDECKECFEKSFASDKDDFFNNWVLGFAKTIQSEQGCFTCSETFYTNIIFLVNKRNYF